MERLATLALTLSLFACSNSNWPGSKKDKTGHDDQPSGGSNEEPGEEESQGPFDPKPDTSVVEGDNATVRLTLLPFGAVSDKAPVEARIFLRNRAISSGKLKLSMHLVDASGAKDSILQESFDLAVGSSKLVVAGIPVAGRAGRLKLEIELQDATSASASPTRVTSSITVVPTTQPSLPFAQVGWLDALALMPGIFPRTDEQGQTRIDASFVGKSLKAFRQQGITTLVLTYVEYIGYYFYPTKFHFLDADVGKQTIYWGEVPGVTGFDVVKTVLEEAASNGMKVYVGLGRSGDSELMNDLYRQNLGGETPPPDSIGRTLNKRLEDALFYGKAKAKELFDAYGTLPSFYGWYLTHETNELASALNYYEPMAVYLKELAPEKPIMVAPAGDPEKLNSLDYAETMNGSHIDVFAYQDSVGTGFDGNSYTFDPAKRLVQLDAYYAKLRNLHDKANAGRTTNLKHLWADLEMWEMDGTSPAKGHYGDPFPAVWPRVAQQLSTETKYVNVVSLYDLWTCFDPAGTGLTLNAAINRRSDYGQRAAALWREYEAFVQAARSQISQ